jgi:hypothetical protein
MAGKIIEIWRNTNYPDQMPVRFSVGQPPMMADGSIPDSPDVSSIEFRLYGEIANRSIGHSLFRIKFEDGGVERYVRADDVRDVAYVSKAQLEDMTPPLESG